MLLSTCITWMARCLINHHMQIVCVQQGARTSLIRDHLGTYLDIMLLVHCAVGKVVIVYNVHIRARDIPTVMIS